MRKYTKTALALLWVMSTAITFWTGTLLVGSPVSAQVAVDGLPQSHPVVYRTAGQQLICKVGRVYYLLCPDFTQVYFVNNAALVPVLGWLFSTSEDGLGLFVPKVEPMGDWDPKVTAKPEGCEFTNLEGERIKITVSGSDR